MTWERFGYICRKASVDCKDHELMSDCLRRIEDEDACKLYGNRIPNFSYSLPRMILDRIAHIKDKNEALAVIEIYKNLSLTKHFEEPMRFKRVIAYLSYVSITFFIIVGIYQLIVAPTFIEAFENFELSLPRHLMFYQDYWAYFVFVVSLFLVSALLIGFQVKKLFKFDIRVGNSFFIKYLVFRNIRQSYIRVIDILQFPILSSMPPQDKKASSMMAHLSAVKNSRMSVQVEMQELIEIEMQFLLESCEKQMKLISALVAVIVVSGIFLFLVSAYSPIFILGETV